jgi:hypothetical protein
MEVYFAAVSKRCKTRKKYTVPSLFLIFISILYYLNESGIRESPVPVLLDPGSGSLTFWV